ncbi:MAG: YkgJ family cysteine cluster protein [Desulfobacterales bacterium]|nr:YkgJ family cysteine cluster protein [Desulfobacterales bacterium]
MTTNTECQRCGTCCKAGGPALHLEDRELVQSGKIPLKDLYTIRKGELARDNVKGTLQPVASELIKIKGQGRSWTCRYYHKKSKGCTIYEDRPLECRILNCRDTAAIEAIYDQQRLTRKDLLDAVPHLWDLVEEHEKKCSYRVLAELAARLKEGPDQGIADNLVEMVGYDSHLRELIKEKGRPDPALLDFLFGRSLTDTLPGFGIRAHKKGGRLMVTPNGI